MLIRSSIYACPGSFQAAKHDLRAARTAKIALGESNHVKSNLMK